MQIEHFKCIVALNKDQNEVVIHSVADDEETHTEKMKFSVAKYIMKTTKTDQAGRNVTRPSVQLNIYFFRKY